MSAIAATSGRSHLVSEEDAMRAQLYRLLGGLLAREPSKQVLGVVRNLQGDDTDLGKAFQSLAGAAERSGEKEITSEFADLFIGMGRGELVPYGSYYLTGFLNEKPLAKLRNTMRELDIERSGDVKEPEDNIGALMVMMAGLIVGDFGEAAAHDTQKEFFEQHIGNWAPHFFKDLETAETAKFYRPVGKIGQLFMEIEKAAFSLA